MNKNPKGFSAVGALIILITLGVLGGVGYYVYNSQNENREPSQEYSDLVNQARAEQEIKDSKNLSLNETVLPEGWSVGVNEENQISLNGPNGCWVDVSHSTDTEESNSSEVNQSKQTVDAIKSKNYTVKELPGGKLTIQTQAGEESVDSQVLSVTGQGNPKFQNYAYLTSETYFIFIQLSCTSVDHIQTAQNALLAITIKK